MIKSAFEEYLNSTKQEGSNKAPSYLRALDLLCIMIQTESFGFDDCVNIWQVNSPQRIHELYEVTLREKRNFHESPWNIENVPRSYLENGFCSAALNAYETFLSTIIFEDHLFDIFNKHEDDEELLPEVLSQESRENEKLLFLPEQRDTEGLDILRKIKARANQHVFRRMVSVIYNQSCCITGLNLPELNRASHIIPWSESAETRLDPRNGLYLSATYDAAFDRHLISLDDDYRIILSKAISDYAMESSVKEYFVDREGQVITLPDRYRPRLDYLEVHRSQGDF